MIILENELVKTTFSIKGAELQELIYKPTNENYLWSGDKNFWGKFSPILFPIVGALKDDTFIFEDKNYHLNRHGFARDNEFDFYKVSDSEILFTFKDSPETLTSYPFEFHLGIRYKLEDNCLICNFEVYNPSNSSNLLFSIGGHPAFSVKTDNEISYHDYYLDFDHDEKLTYHKIDKDLIMDDTHTIQLVDGKLPLKYELFHQDALVFKSLKSNHIVLGNYKNSRRLDFRYDGFPYFGIWAAKNADFICLEPWCGIADAVDHNLNLLDKEGIISLQPNESFSRSWSVTIS
ncbi:aldose 1-epimerase family protein [Pedobacter sp. PWIIR3]